MTDDTPGKPDLSDDMLDRYFAGDCTPAEEALVRQSLGERDHRAVVRRALGEDDAHWDSKKAWASLRPQMRRDRTIQWLAPTNVIRIAAAVVLLVGGAVVGRRMLHGTSGTVVVAAIDVHTGVGERREIILPDSSHVTLAPRSELTYPASFETTGTRDVQLSGRAYFSVTKNAARPFIVHTAGAVARVLGTEFDVREVTQSGDVEVVVAEGRVRLAASVADTLAPVLTAGHLGRFNRALGSVRVTTGVRVEDYLSWREGRLRASGQPLGELAAELSRWYDVDVTVAPTLAARRMSVDVRVGADASLDDVLRALTLPLDARFSRAGRNVTMVPR